MPDGAAYVGRPTIWGNPFRVTRSSDYHGLAGSWFLLDEDGHPHHPDDDTQSSARRRAVELYAAQVLQERSPRISVEMIRAELAGRDLVCWCPRAEPCHADFLLEVANAPHVVAAYVVPTAREATPSARRLRSAEGASGPESGEGAGLRRVPDPGR